MRLNAIASPRDTGCRPAACLQNQRTWTVTPPSGVHLLEVVVLPGTLRFSSQLLCLTVLRTRACVPGL